MNGILTTELEQFFLATARQFSMCEVRRSQIRTGIALGRIKSLNHLKTEIWRRLDRDARARFADVYRCTDWNPPKT